MPARNHPGPSCATPCASCSLSWRNAPGPVGRGPRPAVRRRPVCFRSAAHPRHTAQCGGNRRDDLGAGRHRPTGMDRRRGLGADQCQRHPHGPVRVPAAALTRTPERVHWALGKSRANPSSSEERQVPRGDGRLSHDLDPQRPGPQDACGVFGVWAPGEEVAKLTYFGLYALQHRGQEAAGIAVSDGSGVVVYKDLGLVAQVFDEPTLASLRGHIAIGHTRYSTTGALHLGERPADAAHPSGRRAAAPPSRWRTTATWSTPPSWPAQVAELGLDADGDLRHRAGHHAARRPARPLGRGGGAGGAADACAARSASSSWTRSTLYAARDAQGVRPLVLGRLERGWVVASETAALDIVGASFVREVEPGELIAIDEHGLRSSPVRHAGAQGLPVRVRVPGPAGHHDRRPQHVLGPRRDRPPAGPGAPGRGRPGHPGARVGHPGRDRLRRGVRHPVQRGPGQERLRRAYLHPAVARPSASWASG